MEYSNHFLKSFFEELSSSEIELLLSYFEFKHIKKSDFFCKQFSKCKSLAFIQKGMFRIYTTNSKGKEITQWISSENELITSVQNFFFNNVNNFTIEALTDAEIFSISKENYSKLCIEFSLWNIIEKKILTTCFSKMEERILGFLSLHAQQRYEIYFEKNKTIFNEVPLQYIASVLGISPETLSRIRKQKR